MFTVSYFLQILIFQTLEIEDFVNLPEEEEFPGGKSGLHCELEK